MTYEEALAKLLDLLKTDDYKMHKHYDAVVKGCEAIKKQIPKKAVRKKYFSECPNCACDFIDCGMPDYCEYCGQAIDWSGEE